MGEAIIIIIIIMDTCIALLVHCMKMCLCCGLYFFFVLFPVATTSVARDV